MSWRKQKKRKVKVRKSSIYTVIGTIFSALFLGLVFIPEPNFEISGLFAVLINPGSNFTLPYILALALALICAVVCFALALDEAD